MFSLTTRQIAMTSALVCGVVLWFALQQKNQATSVIYLVSLGFATVLYARAASFLRAMLREMLDLSQVAEESRLLRGTYERTAVMVKQVFIYIACTVVTVPAYALIVPENRAASLGIQAAAPALLALLAIKTEFGLIVACMAAYCVEPYRLRIEAASTKRSTLAANAKVVPYRATTRAATQSAETPIPH